MRAEDKALLVLGSIVAGVLLLGGGVAVVGLRFLLNDDKKKYLPLIKTYADRYGIDPFIFAGLVAKESGFNPKAFRREAGYKWGTNPDFPDPDGDGPLIGGDASYGLVQIMYSNAKAMGYSGEPNGLFDPDLNLHFGAIFFKGLLTRYGNYPDALSAYNSGRPLAKAPDSTANDYVPKTTGYAAYFKDQNVFA